MKVWEGRSSIPPTPVLMLTQMGAGGLEGPNGDLEQVSDTAPEGL